VSVTLRNTIRNNAMVQNDPIHQGNRPPYTHTHTLTLTGDLLFPLTLKSPSKHTCAHRWGIMTPKLHSSDCQRVKNSVRSCAVQKLSHLPTKPSDLDVIYFLGGVTCRKPRVSIYIYMCVGVCVCVSTCLRNF
jgi:hypothetical protein